MTDEERIERLENKLKDVTSWWRAAEKQFSQKCKETKTNQKTIERLEAKNAELSARLKKVIGVPFVVLDKTTGKEADLGEIALHEEWAKSLAYCDMDGFAITQDGALLLLDECGKFEYCPPDRFEIIAEARLKEIKEKKDD